MSYSFLNKMNVFLSLHVRLITGDSICKKWIRHAFAMHGRLFVIRVIIDAWQKIIQSNCTRTVIYITATFSYRTVHTLTLVSTSLQRLPLYKSHFSTKATSLSPKGGRFGRVQRKWNGEYDFVHILRKMADMGKFANWSKRLKQFVVISVCTCGNVFPLYSNLRSGSIFVSLWKLHEKHSNWAWSQVTFILDVDVGRLSRLACE